MNYSRKDLVQTDATMNQMRNSIYILASFMEKNGVLDLKEKLRKMGQNIAKTYIRYWKPTNFVDISNLKDVIATIYQKVFNSSTSIEINDVENLIKVQDYRCALCKYHYDNIEIAGCEIILGMVSETISLINKESSNPSSLILEPYEVKESRAFGNKTCVQLYKYKTGRTS
ncbi:MAG: hypothetical protein HWN81_03925 [Candidatus Lokiarchaeota archaeon]|nr:hypothetical protein [Candidatus Lokiarchaeota archaeon]